MACHRGLSTGTELTQQISDRLRLEGGNYFVLGVHGSGLFEPSKFGLKVRFISTACYRGFHCGYAVQGDGMLVLEEVYLGLEDDPAGRDATLFGRKPESYWRHGQKWTKEGLEDHSWSPPEKRLTALCEPVAFDGGLLIGTGWLQDVRELTFQAGRLVSTVDGSAMVDRILERPRAEGAATVSDSDLEDWKARLDRYGYRRQVSAVGRNVGPTEETCVIEVVATEGLPDGFSPYLIYVNGNIRGPRPRSEDTKERQVLHLKPGTHRIVVRGREVHDPERVESNTLHFEVNTGDRFQVEARMSGASLLLTMVGAAEK